MPVEKALVEATKGRAKEASGMAACQPTTTSNKPTSSAAATAEPSFQSDKVYVLDGGFATHLTKVVDDGGAMISDPLWSCGALQRCPDAVVRAHADFLDAGANIITTNTYQANAKLFRKHLKFEDPVLDPHLLMESAPELARKATGKVSGGGGGRRGAKKSALIVGSVGPYGACLGDGSEYNGHYIESEGLSEPEMRQKLKAWHTDRIKRLAVGGIRMFAVETIPSVLEALAVLDVLEELPGTRCWISFQCRDGGMTTARGEPLDEAFCTLAHHPEFRYKVKAIGANCVHPKDVENILRQFNKVNHWSKFPNVLSYNKIPYVVYPNSGRTFDPVKKCFASSEKNLDAILDNLKLWMSLGANVIGGCCEIGPEDIKVIGEKVFLEVFDAMEERAKMEAAGRNDRDDWVRIQERLKKPSYEELKKKREQMSGFVKDLTGDGGVGAFSRMHHEVEHIILDDEQKKSSNDSGANGSA